MDNKSFSKLSFTNEITTTEKNKREKIAKENATHGSALFPCAYYNSWLVETYPAINLHWHPELEVNLVLKGNAEAIINFESYNVSEGDIVIINKDEVHGFFRNESTDFNCKAVVFHLDFIGGKTTDDIFMEFIAPLANKEKQFVNLLNADFPGYNVLKRELEEILKVYEEKAPFYKLLLKSRILNLLYLLFSFQAVRTVSVSSKRNTSMKAAIDFIAQNYNRHISAEEAAAVAGYSKYHFLRVFKDAVGMEFSRYVNRVRFDHAVLLLKETGLSITDIALATGFSDSAYFTRKFKEEFHTTPLIFRKTTESS